MSQLKKNVLKTMVMLAQTIETQSEVLAGAVGQKVDPVRKGWQRFDAPSKVKNVQDKTRPIGKKIQSSMSGKTIPGADAAIWGERHMSLPAILLILVFGGVFALIGLSGPNSMLGGRH